MRPVPLLSAAALALMTLPALADRVPPANAMPLSEILAQIEAAGDVAHFEEVEWDDDGYWEVEYRRTDGARVELKLDPVTAQPLR